MELPLGSATLNFCWILLFVLFYLRIIRAETSTIIPPLLRSEDGYWNPDGTGVAALPQNSTPGLVSQRENEMSPPPVAPKPSLSPKLIKQIEVKLLSMLGLKSRPRPNRAKVNIPQHMLDLYREQMSANEGLQEDSVQIARKSGSKKHKSSFMANTVRSFSHQDASHEDDMLNCGHKERLTFDIKTIPTNEDIKAADLRIYFSNVWSDDFPFPDITSSPSSQNQTTSSSRNHKRLLVTIHEILSHHHSMSNENLIVRQLDTQLVDLSNNSQWITLDILPAVQRWQLSPSENFGLQLEMLTPDGRPLSQEHWSSNTVHVANPLRRRRRSVASDSGLTQQTTDWVAPKQQPAMLVYSDDPAVAPATPRPVKTKTNRRVSAGSRPLHSNSQHARSHNRNVCRRQNLYVDFSDVGWNDWIVAPPGYQAFFCAGECVFPLADHLNTTNHATVQSLVHNANTGAVPRVCCIPTELSPISLLYLDEYDKVVLKNYQDMVVEGCGCR